MTARGFIETKGLLATIEAADVMVKAADVRIVGTDCVGSGLVTVTVAGEVSAVRAAVDAAVRAVHRINGAELVTAHVITRPYEEVLDIIATKEPWTGPENTSQVAGGVKAPAVSKTPTIRKDTTGSGVPGPSEAARDSKRPAEQNVESAPAVEPAMRTRVELQRTAIGMLRRIALDLGNISLTRQEIRTATKNKLIEAICKATNR